jgi:penicillin-binding protein 1C
MNLRFSEEAGGRFLPLNREPAWEVRGGTPETGGSRGGNRFLRDFFGLKGRFDHKELFGPQGFFRRRFFSRPLFRVSAVLGGLLLIFYGLLRFSPYGELEAFLRRPHSVRFYDRRGVLVQIPALEGGIRREYRPLSEIPPELAAVFVFAEDARFYHHPGIDPIALIRALYQNLRGGRRVSGASTITMQLARLISPRGETGWSRKIGEAYNALRLETRLTKDKILELYLNALPFGFQTEGVSSAARTFFASEPAMLSPAQIFCLAVIPRRPAAYNPLTEGEANIAAARELYARFTQNQAHPGPVVPPDWDFAAASVRRFEYPFEMPHFVRFAGAELAREAELSRERTERRGEGTAERAAGKTGKRAGGSREQLRGPGTLPGEITLSADLTLQHYLEDLIAAHIHRYYTSRLTNGAAVVIDNETGEILAWVGSADFFNEEAAGQVDGVLARNQPGSGMKPFLYALALERGFMPTEVLADIPMHFGTDALYIPQNFNNRFNGPMLFRAALASSLNIPAVYLLYRLGVGNYTAFLRSLGFDFSEETAASAGLGLALGNAPVSIAELARAFSVFPRDGLLIPLSWKRQPRDSVPEAAYPLVSPDTARLICSFLSDRNARVLAFGSGRNFSTPFPAIFKTGTANQYQSILALGATPRYTAAVWMGNFTGETVIGKTGSSIPAEVVRDTLIFLQGRDGPDFAEPEGFVRQEVCALSGMAPTAACFSRVSEYVRRGSEPPACTWHRLEGGRPTVSYPAEYQSWFFASRRWGELDYSGAPLEILTPREGFVFLTSPGTGRNEIPLEVIGGLYDELRVYYDDEPITLSRPFVFYLPPDPGPHTLTVQNGEERVTVNFRVE